MFDSVIKAIIAGFVLSVMIGPVFFLLLETSIRKGVRAALAFDCGVFLSDIIYILLAYVFYNEVANLLDGDNNYLIQFFGGIIFLVFGLVTLLKKPEAMSKEDSEGINQTKDYLMLGLKGFLLNFANPAVIVYWFSVIAFGAKKLEKGDSSSDYMWLYITVLIITFFSIDILKILGAKKLRPFITDRVLTGLNRLTGLIILICGIVLFARGISKFL
ncbi:MAG TPA: LysE family transporter [Fluviicola sp.]|nr:LysE family transporter [Fluviicola sp.]